MDTKSALPPDTRGSDSEKGQPTSTGRRDSKDEDLLAAMGHTQELRRSFSVWSLGGLCLCLVATWEGLASVVALALLSGGAPCLFYNFIISTFGTIAIALSLAEIASIYPTAGGQYHWVAVLAPENRRLAASWFTGWISIGGQICLTAFAAFAAGLQYQGLITLNHLDTYTPARYQGMLFYWAVLAYSLIINVFGSRILPHTNTASSILHIVGFVAIAVTLLATTTPKHSAHYVFVETSNETGWQSDGLAWLIGLLSTVSPFLGYDAACHLSEELPSPAKNVPLAMVGSVVLNAIMGFIFCVILLFCLGDLQSLLTSPVGFPFIQLFYNSTSSYAGATIMTLIITLIATAANSAGLTSTSRTFWAFARDNAIPGSRYFAHVHPTLKVPVRMIVLVSVLQMLLGFIYLASYTAFNAVLSMATLGMYVSYLLPIVYMLLYGRKPGLVFGPFRLGYTTGIVINIIAIAWLIVACFFSTFPNFYPVTSGNMNYSTAVLGGWVLFGGIYLGIWGRKKYTGPIMEG